MNVSQFDGSAAFHGGSFMPAATNPTPEQSSIQSKTHDSQTLLPVTIKQINNAVAQAMGKFSIDNVDVATVKIVGIVHDFTGRTTDSTIIVDDGTGRIECTRWCQVEADTAEVEKISKGMYVRILGLLKSFQGMKTITVFSVRPVEDYNEIASHFIECMYVHLYNSKLPKPQVGVDVTTQPYGTIPPNQVSGQYSPDMQNIKDRVLHALSHQSYSEAPGANIYDIALQLNLQPEDVKCAMLQLVDVDSVAYSTIDDDHYILLC